MRRSLLGKIEQEQIGKDGAAERHAKNAENLPIDHGINHPFKGLVKSQGKDKHGLKALMSILNILANNGGTPGRNFVFYVQRMAERFE